MCETKTRTSTKRSIVEQCRLGEVNLPVRRGLPIRVQRSWVAGPPMSTEVEVGRPTSPRVPPSPTSGRSSPRTGVAGPRPPVGGWVPLVCRGLVSRPELLVSVVPGPRAVEGGGVPVRRTGGTLELGTSWVGSTGSVRGVSPTSRKTVALPTTPTSEVSRGSSSPETPRPLTGDVRNPLTHPTRITDREPSGMWTRDARRA